MGSEWIESSGTRVTALSGGDGAYRVGSPLCRCICLPSFGPLSVACTIIPVLSERLWASSQTPPIYAGEEWRGCICSLTHGHKVVKQRLQRAKTRSERSSLSILFLIRAHLCVGGQSCAYVRVFVPFMIACVCGRAYACACARMCVCVCVCVCMCAYEKYDILTRYRINFEHQYIHYC